MRLERNISKYTSDLDWFIKGFIKISRLQFLFLNRDNIYREKIIVNLIFS